MPSVPLPEQPGRLAVPAAPDAVKPSEPPLTGRDACFQQWFDKNSVPGVHEVVLKNAFSAGWEARKRAEYGQKKPLDNARLPVATLFPTDAELDPK
jgi:hypothetical protein